MGLVGNPETSVLNQESKKKDFVDSWPLKMGPIGNPETSVLNQESKKKDFVDSWPLKMGLTGNPETSVSNHLTPRSNPEDGIIQLNRVGGRGVRLRYRKIFILTKNVQKCTKWQVKV